MSTSLERLEYLMTQVIRELMELRIFIDNRISDIQSLNAGASRLESNSANSGPNELPQAAPQIHIPSSIMPWTNEVEGDDESS